MLRSYQQKAVEDVEKAWSEGSRAVVLVLPTGAGKTRTAAAICSRYGKVEWRTHRQELLAQAQNVVPPNVRVRMILDPAKDDVDLLVVDECHHANASTWRDMVQGRTVGRILGLTATPTTSDGSALGHAFDRLVAGPSVAELIEAGHLAPLRVYAPQKRVKGQGFDLRTAWEKHGKGRQTLVYARSLLDAREADIPGAVVLSASTSKRRETIEGFRKGDVTTLVNCMILTEGTDLPNAETAILGRSCTSQSLYLQIAGRVMRPAIGKEYGVLVDLSGAVHDHGMPDEARQYSLEGKAIKRLSGAPAVKQCPKCGAAFAPCKVCPLCGYEFPPPPPPPKKWTDLQEIAQADPIPTKQAFYHQMLAIAKKRGYRKGYAAVMYKNKYGDWPTREITWIK